MPRLRTLLHLLLALAVIGQGVLPAFAASGTCAHAEHAIAPAPDAASPPCHDGAAPPSADGARDCCGYASCNCACLLTPAMPTATAVGTAIAAPDAIPAGPVAALVLAARAPANPPPIA